jgi:hypothetical protein
VFVARVGDGMTPEPFAELSALTRCLITRSSAVLRPGIATALNKHVEDEIILIDCPPKPVLLAERAASVASIP